MHKWVKKTAKKTGVTPLWPLAMATKSGQNYVELVLLIKMSPKQSDETLHWFGQ